MNNPTATPDPTAEQSPGTDPRSKRNSGLFAFFKWFKPGSRESIADDSSRSTSSLESIASDKSSGTVASFRFVPPAAYQNKVVQEKQVPIGPETDTYKARLKQRDKRRETDKNVTLRKKYNLFFNKETLLRPDKPLEEDENSKSLPLMTRTHIMEVEPQKVHRRTNSESSKVKRAGAYLHVKGKRKAPQPPGTGKLSLDSTSTASLKRKKRAAPAPPPTEKEVLANDYLKLDHGVLKPVKEDARPKTPQENPSGQNVNALSPSSSRTSFVEAPVSPRPWYKRNSTSKEVLTKKENKYEPVERLPEVQFMRNSTLDLTLEDSLSGNAKKDEKRRSGMLFLTNISELDREASEIIRNKAEYERTGVTLSEIPEFMKPKEVKPAANDSWVSPKRRSARDLIAKFNAITNVTKVSVFGGSQKDKYFGKQTSLDETRQRQEQLLESHKKRIEDIDKKKEDRFAPLMKSESASAVKLGATSKDVTPKMERKSWRCPKCNLDNEYWRIICHVCSAIKPYFDDFASSSKSIDSNNKPTEPKSSSPVALRKEPAVQNSAFERSKTQIGFSALASYNANNKPKTETSKSSSEDKSKVDDTSKKEERERLKKMLIEMKNSLPKRKSNMLMKQTSRTSIIMENPEVAGDKQEEDKKADQEKTQEEKVAEILIGTNQTIYENIKMRKTDNPKPHKVSSSAQTSAVVKKIVPDSTLKKLIENHKQNNAYEPMKVQDFEDIYSEKNGKNTARIYANLAQNDELSLFFNVPKSGDFKNNKFSHNTDTIEINRLLRRLETAIAKGDMTQAAIFAKELAQLKVDCSVIRQKPQGCAGKKKGFQIEMYVEDKVSHRGPFPIDVTEIQTVAELKQQISQEFEIPVEVQRWILGKELVTDDNTTLKDHKITEGCPVFLYLVAPEKKPREFQINKTSASVQPSTSAAQGQSAAVSLGSKSQVLTTNNVPIIPEVPRGKSAEPVKTEAPKVVNVNTKITEIPRGKSAEPLKIEAAKVVDVNAKISQGQRGKSAEPVKIESLKVVDVNAKVSQGERGKSAEPVKIESPKVVVAVNAKVPETERGKSAEPAKVEAPKFERGKIETSKFVKVEADRRISAGPVKIEAPKVVNVIPKSSESGQGKPELVRIIPIQREPVQTPASLTEIKVDIRPFTSRLQQNQNFDKGLVMATSTKVEVLQAPPAVVVNGKPQKESCSANKTEPATPKPLDVRLPELSIGIYPNLSKISPSNAPKAKAEESLEEYDSSTLKPPKEWECHLCTLLNPDSSNICAVCATVRIKKTSLRKSNKKKPAPQPQKDQTYLQLVNLDSADLVSNADVFECLVCYLEVAKGEGVTLRECLHQFCRDCLARTVEFADDAEVKCPYRDEEYSCNIALQEREIKALVSPAVYEQHLAKSVTQAENKMEKTFHCKTPDCKGWCIFEDNVNEFRCPVCRKTNCLTCQAIHMGANCKQYQERMKDESSLNEDAKRTKDFLEEMVEKGEAIACPTCKVILMKKWGCDWLRCSMCKTEICWVTRGPRWGPGGKGDTSGGCQCGLNGVKCHPKCNYCH